MLCSAGIVAKAVAWAVLGERPGYRTQCERMRWPRRGGGRHRVARGGRMAFDVSGSLPIHRHTELSPAMTEPIGRLVLPAMDCRHREHQAMKGWAMRGSACAFLASVSLGGCAAPDPQHTLDSLLQQQNALEFFCEIGRAHV